METKLKTAQETIEFLFDYHEVPVFFLIPDVTELVSVYELGLFKFLI